MIPSSKVAVTPASHLAVIPAKAGIQALNGSRAPRATQKHNCGWLRPCALGYFSLLMQRKVTKRNTPRMARLLPALLAGIGARLNSSGAKYVPRAQTRGSLPPIPAAMLGRAIRGFENTAPILFGVESIQLNI